MSPVFVQTTVTVPVIVPEPVSGVTDTVSIVPVNPVPAKDNPEVVVAIIVSVNVAAVLRDVPSVPPSVGLTEPADRVVVYISS